MNLTELLLIAVALSMDAFAVTLSNSLIFKQSPLQKKLLMPLFFGLFQGIMPLLGFYAGGILSDFIDQYAGIITFIILGLIGGNMIKEALSKKDDEDTSTEKFTLKLIFIQAIATSIDAFAVGVSFCAMQANIILAVSLISIITALICVVAIMLANKYAEKIGDKSEILGGAILILIGIKSLF